MTESDIKLVRELRGTMCVCGAEKQSKMSHCRVCYYSLPERQRRALYRRLGSGYAEAYEESLTTLKAVGRLRVSK